MSDEQGVPSYLYQRIGFRPPFDRPPHRANVFEYSGTVIGIDVKLRSNTPLGQVVIEDSKSEIVQALSLLNDAFAMQNITLTNVTLEIKT